MQEELAIYWIFQSGNQMHKVTQEPPVISSEDVTQTDNRYGVVQSGEEIQINEVGYKVERFTKKTLALSTKNDYNPIGYKKGECVKIKHRYGLTPLEVVSTGKNWLNLRAKPGVQLYDYKVIHKARIDQLEKMKAGLLLTK